MMVDVVDEGVQGPHPLGEPLGDGVPLALAESGAGTMSNGHSRSMPPGSPVSYTVKVMPMVRIANSAAAARSERASSVSRESTRSNGPGAGAGPAGRGDELVPEACCFVLLPIDGHCWGAG